MNVLLQYQLSSFKLGSHQDRVHAILHNACLLWKTAAPTLISASMMGVFALPAA
jgi:hypothetical protein